MIRLTKRNVGLLYTLAQMLFWGAFALMFSFASAYLQGKGFSNGEIGMTLACSYALSAVLQPGIASLLRHMWIRQEKGLCGLYFLVAVLSLLLLFLPLRGVGLGILMAIAFSLYSSLQPLVNSLAQRWSSSGFPIEFSSCRAVASLFFSGVTAATGWVLQRISPLLLPSFYCTVVAISACFFLLLVPPEPQAESTKPVFQGKGRTKLRLPTGFPVLLLGIGCLSLGHTLVDNFMLKIMQSFGGGSQNQGVALSIASLVEVPALWLYGRIRRRCSDRTLLIFAAWAWMLKTFLIFLARSPVAIYAAETLQFCSYAFYTPASVHCADQWFSPEHRLQGQSLIGSAYTAGCVLAAFLGGLLLDAVGVSHTLLAIVGTMTLGAVLVSASARSQRSCPSLPHPGAEKSS